MERIVFFDIDGTLMDKDKRIPISAQEAIQRLKQNGVRVALATGRAPFMFRDVLQQLEIDDFVSFNGQYVESKGQVLYQKALPASRLREMEAMAHEHEHPMVFMDAEKMTANVADHPWVTESIGELKLDPPPYAPNDLHKREICQALLFCEEEEQARYMESFSDLHFIRWHRFSLDVLPGGGSKALGIRKLCDHYGISADNVYAFGDAANDVEMLRAAAVGVAMGDAEPVAAEAADWLTRTAEEDGIAYGLSKLGLI